MIFLGDGGWGGGGDAGIELPNTITRDPTNMIGLPLILKFVFLLFILNDLDFS